MPETWWKMNSLRLEPTPIEVLRETEHTLVIPGYRDGERRVNKVTSWERYFPTWEEAMEWKRARAERQVGNARARVEAEERERDAILRLIERGPPDGDE